MTARLPRGLLGRLADVVLCSAGDAAAGTCPAGSWIGSVVAGAGAGPLPFYLSGGRVYVTGPYGGAPFGLSVVVPAVAGPFDLGTVVVRAAVFVDRHTAALRAVTDPLPSVLQGIPLQIARRAGGGGSAGVHGESDWVRGEVGAWGGVVVERSGRGGVVALPGRRLRSFAVPPAVATVRRVAGPHARAGLDAADGGADAAARGSGDSAGARDVAGRGERAAAGGERRPARRRSSPVVGARPPESGPRWL